MEWPTLGWLIATLTAIAVPIIVILIVLWIIRRETIRKQQAVRSPEYWKEQPDGRRYPTGWHQSPGGGSSDWSRRGYNEPPPRVDGKPQAENEEPEDER